MKTIILIILFPFMLNAQPDLLLLYGGASFDPLTYDARTTAYLSRVTTDGGVTIDTSAVDSAYVYGDADIATLWVGSDYGVKKDANDRVTKFYDLSDSTFDIIQVDTSLSPLWTSGGTHFFLPPHTAGDYMDVTFGVAKVDSMTICLAGSHEDAVSGYYYDGVAAGNRHALYNSDLSIYSGAGAVTGSSVINGTEFLVTVDWGYLDTLYLNSAYDASGNSGTHTLTGIVLYNRPAHDYAMNGIFRELVIYPTNGVRAKLEAVINAHWDIY